MIIRHLEPDDFERIANITDLSSKEFALPKMDSAVIEEQFQPTEDHPTLSLVVINDNQIKGLAGVSWLEPTLAEIHTLYIASELRGRGNGKFILDMLLNFCKTNGFKKAVVFLNGKMNEAKKLFERNKFKEVKDSIWLRKYAPKERSNAYITEL
jgi:N-acetylglutamate synthase-like GNAT family acetyltransferase